jgi:hypothetical protein
MKLTLLLLTLTSCAALAATEESTNKTFQVLARRQAGRGR